ncbi:MAG: ACT domain-containing protein [Blastocatellia bacterium]|nr:ACT domain-containing protein [Blastocatellia bacterium]
MNETEEVVYKITRAVYERLGEKATPEIVEALVGDLFAAVKPLLAAREKVENKPVSESPTTNRYVISVFGIDQPGIVASVSTLLAEANCSIIDINQTVVQRKFAMIMIIGASNANRDLNQLRASLKEIGQKLGVSIYIQREDIFHAMHRI